MAQFQKVGDPCCVPKRSKNMDPWMNQQSYFLLAVQTSCFSFGKIQLIVSCQHHYLICERYTPQVLYERGIIHQCLHFSILSVWRQGQQPLERLETLQFPTTSDSFAKPICRSHTMHSLCVWEGKWWLYIGRNTNLDGKPWGSCMFLLQKTAYKHMRRSPPHITNAVAIMSFNVRLWWIVLPLAYSFF